MLLLAGLAMVVASCDNQKTYAQQLEEMQTDITSFMAAHNFSKTDVVPDSIPWLDESGHRLFYETESGLYIHLIDTGLQAGGTKKGQVVAVRYIEMSVQGDTVTYSNYYGAYDPVNITYGTVSTGGSSSYYWGDCQAWHEPLQWVGDGGHVMVIAPSDLGMPIYSVSQSVLLAHYYELKYTYWK